MHEASSSIETSRLIEVWDIVIGEDSEGEGDPGVWNPLDYLSYKQQ